MTSCLLDPVGKEAISGSDFIKDIREGLSADVGHGEELDFGVTDECQLFPIEKLPSVVRNWKSARHMRGRVVR